MQHRSGSDNGESNRRRSASNCSSDVLRIILELAIAVVGWRPRCVVIQQPRLCSARRLAIPCRALISFVVPNTDAISIRYASCHDMV